MARGLRGLPRRGLWLLLVSHLFMATACQDATFSTLLHELCLAQFQVDMEAVGRPLWCDWGKTIGAHPWPLGRSAGSASLPAQAGPLRLLEQDQNLVCLQSPSQLDNTPPCIVFPSLSCEEAFGFSQ
ncbi:receptor activity-modifying protein 1 isoform X2 [Physeter macrocephalus]|uniref:Receptor activity-modifying protein 1 n=1 Tax=Physeter macrocephalus TaxID=9755 RepID=A0A455AQD8_PHYMC|nr:receptor activity-modifying protein 1 isoform X2 [Physeter catodon]|eukprot:XP_028338787.1 receptor activity-modifying protein 1 isoform X2 [Physeter catodon]